MLAMACNVSEVTVMALHYSSIVTIVIIVIVYICYVTLLT